MRPAFWRWTSRNRLARFADWELTCQPRSRLCATRKERTLYISQQGARQSLAAETCQDVTGCVIVCQARSSVPAGGGRLGHKSRIDRLSLTRRV